MQAGITFRPAAWVAEPSELAADRRAVTLAAGAVPWARSVSSGVAACSVIVTPVTTAWTWPPAPVPRQDDSWFGQLSDAQGAGEPEADADADADAWAVGAS